MYINKRSEQNFDVLIIYHLYLTALGDVTKTSNVCSVRSTLVITDTIGTKIWCP